MTTDASPALTARNHILFWMGTFAAFLLFIWAFGNTLLPFVLGIAIAYLLDPMVEWLGRHKVPRTLATLLILGLFIIFICAIFVLAIPPLYHQLADLADAIPGYIERAVEFSAPYLEKIQENANGEEGATLQEALKNNIGNVLNVSADVLGKLASGGQAFAGFMSLIILTPLVAFFIMREWRNMSNWLDNQLPRGSYDTIKGLLKEIDKRLSGFVRGQITVAFLLGVIYAFALTVAGLNYGFLIGIMAGVLSIIPLVGSTVGLLTATIVAWMQSGEWSYTAIIAAIFMIGQAIEGNILTPKILGESVGLHPLWILFALLAGGSAFGLVGMLLAVPIASVAGVLMGFALMKYRESPYYEDGNKKTSAKKAKK